MSHPTLVEYHASPVISEMDRSGCITHTLTHSTPGPLKTSP